jgi:Tol biopolymer transport system component
MNADGSRSRVLTAERSIGFLTSGPTWGRDGKEILFIGGYVTKPGSDIYRIGLDGKGLKRLTFTRADEGSVQMSPDGQLIAFVTRDECICLIPAGGGDPMPVVSWTGKSGQIAWSADSSSLVSAGGPHGGRAIRFMRIDGSDQRRLTDETDIIDLAWGPSPTAG